jgi:hypothetical protein
MIADQVFRRRIERRKAQSREQEQRQGAGERARFLAALPSGGVDDRRYL